MALWSGCCHCTAQSPVSKSTLQFRGNEGWNINPMHTSRTEDFWQCVTTRASDDVFAFSRNTWFVPHWGWPQYQPLPQPGAISGYDFRLKRKKTSKKQRISETSVVVVKIRMKYIFFLPEFNATLDHVKRAKKREGEKEKNVWWTGWFSWDFPSLKKKNIRWNPVIAHPLTRKSPKKDNGPKKPYHSFYCIGKKTELYCINFSVPWNALLRGVTVSSF